MNLKLHTGRLLAICTFSGFAIGTGLVAGYRHVDNAAYELGSHSVALREVDNLDTQLRDYLYLSDLILLRDVTGLLDSTLRWSDEIRSIAERLAETQLASDKTADIDSLVQDVARVQAIIEEGATIAASDNRRDRMVELAGEVEDVATSLIERTDRLASQMRRRSSIHEEDLGGRRMFLYIATWASAIVYSVIVLMAWFWSVQTMVRPIERLSDAAERARLGNETLEPVEEGPDEVRRLSRNVSQFVRTRADFLATMSHELRTPLNGVINMNELMLATPLDEEQRELAQSARSAGQALFGIINDILDFSKIQANKLTLENEPFSIRELVDGTIDIFRGRSAPDSLLLAGIVDHRVCDEVRGDATRLRQVLVNLVGNAVKFTAKGRVIVRIGIHPDDEDLLLFRVEDTGPGVPEEVQPRLFHAFQQGDSSTTRNFGGTGLGLAICRELSNLMGGSIGLESTEGVGSTFWFSARLTHTARPTTPPKRGRVVVHGLRPEILESTTERLLAAGTHEDDILTVSDSESFPSLLCSGDRVLLDGAGLSDGVNETIVLVRDQIGSDGRIAVLEDRVAASLRGVVDSSTPRIPISTSIPPLQSWLTATLLAAGDTESSKPLSGHILVVDDNPINRRVACAFLEKAGCTTDTAVDGQDAIDKLLQYAFHVVLMDCQMPRLDGFEATRRIRGLEQNQRLASPSPLPIVALTADDDRSRIAACHAAGMQAVVSKPFGVNDLLTEVRRALSNTSTTSLPATAQQAGSPRPAQPPTTEAAALRVLIVDDNKMNQRVLDTIVRRAGYATTLATDGQQAVDHLRSHACDLVLMDCQMPVLDGWEATRVIRELESLGQLPRGTRSPLPIVAVTANAMDGDRERCMEAGMNEYLTKPVKAPKVLATIGHQLSS